METGKNIGGGLEAGLENERRNAGSTLSPDRGMALRYCSAYCVIVTVEREYHLVEDVCAGVRERGTGKWLVGHQALNRRVGGAVCKGSCRPAFFPGVPRVGEAMWFEAGEQPLQTEPVLGIEYPASIGREFLLQLTFRAAVSSALDSSTISVRSDRANGQRPAAVQSMVVLSAPVALEDAGPAGKAAASQPRAGEQAARMHTVSLKPRRPYRAATAPALPGEKIFNFFSHILMPATP
jgi:hypothetical protein